MAANMELEKAKSILPGDYDDEDSEEEEEEEELFDNSKVDWRVKGNLLRGKEFTVSDNGNCPRCQSNIFVFVILDELFPMGDMPEILYNLLAKGKAVLWSSQDKQSCKKPPTFMCRGFCPADPLGAGFNINWDTVNLTKLLKDLLKLNLSKAQKLLQMKEKATDEEKDAEDEELDEDDIIRAMLAEEKEKQKEVSKPDPEPKTDVKSEPPASTQPATGSTSSVVSTSTTAVTSMASVASTTAKTSSTSAASKVEYPVSKDGSCPYCSSSDVRYIILVKDTNKDATLPPTLDLLLKQGKAFKMAKGASNPPSFQCCTCTYGFNLDWSSTDLKKIFKLDQPQTPATTAVAMTTAAGPYSYPNCPPANFQPPAYQNAGYSPYGYPPMYYPSQPMPYSYPTPGYGALPPTAPPPGIPPPFGGSPPPFGGIPPPSGFLPPGGLPPPGLPPRGIPPQHGMPPGPGPVQPGFSPPEGYPQPGFPPSYRGARMYGMPPRPPNPGYPNAYGQQYPGNVQGNFNFNQNAARFRGPTPRLRVPRGPMRGRFNRRKKWHAPHKHHAVYYGTQAQQTSPENYEAHEQWSGYTEESEEHEEAEGTEEDAYDQAALDPEAADRFEELLNRIDGTTTENEYAVEHGGEEEKPPGEESQAEFVVAFNTPEEKPTEEKNDTPNENHTEHLKRVSDIKQEQKDVSLPAVSNSDPALQVKETSGKLSPGKEPLEKDIPSEVTVPGTGIVASQQVKQELETSTNLADASGNEESQNSMTSELKSPESELETPPASRKPARSKKRASTGRKKAGTSRATAKRKKVEKKAVEEVAIKDTPEQNAISENKDEPLKQEEMEAVEKPVKEPAKEPPPSKKEEPAKEEEPKPFRRVTRARAQKMKS